mmetsp:Transcript_17683/g.40988  ORF Transcript_17683/g.40988 Transcript_17683/m.40988 type:complete len:909 (+) Transcript_17683:97-2823(+)
MAAAIDFGGTFKEQAKGDKSRDVRYTLGELVQLLVELLPDEVDLCIRLLRSLGNHGRVASIPLGHDAADLHRVIAQFIDSDPACAENATMQRFQKDFNTQKRCQSTKSTKQMDSSQGHDGDSNEGADDSETNGRSLDLSQLPWFPLELLGSMRWRFFLVLDQPSKSLFGKFMEMLIVLVIVVSTVSFVMESMPRYRSSPDECERLRRAGLPLTVKDCEPRPDSIFFALEAVCISFFTLEYIWRIATVHANPLSTQRGWLITWRYVCMPLNLIDLVAIVPFYIDLAVGGETNLGFVKILRLVRILRLFKMAKHHPGMQMFVEAFVMSGQPLLILVFFNAIVGVIFASLMYSAEGQRFSVASKFTAEPAGGVSDCAGADPFFPTGVFVRRDSQMESDIISPFRSIPYGVWWVAVTMTTVGYGEMVPTTILGKAIGVVCFYVGIILLAMPIGVLSTNFEIVYMKFREKTAKAAERRRGVKSRKTRSSAVAAWGSRDELFRTPQSLRRKTFLLFADPRGSQLSRTINLGIFITIFVSVVAFVMESMPEFNHTPNECSRTHLSVNDCAPEPDVVFFWIEVACTTVFTVEYLLRVCTVHAVRREEAGLYVEEELSPLVQTLYYCKQPMNVIDLLSIIPFYVELAGSDGRGAAVLKVLRLVRVFRVMKTPKLRACVDMFLSVLVDSLPAILILIVLTALMCVFFAACIVFAEGSEYSVDHCPEVYPNGVYIRPTVDGYGREATPFTSILYAFWWFFTTATTVGYGDDFPTTMAGRCVGVLTSYTGIILLALPVTIVGGSFNKYYPEWVAEFESTTKRASMRVSATWTSTLTGSPMSEASPVTRLRLSGELKRLSEGEKDASVAPQHTSVIPFQGDDAALLKPTELVTEEMLPQVPFKLSEVTTGITELEEVKMER